MWEHSNVMRESRDALKQINLLLASVRERAKVWAQGTDPKYSAGQDARSWDRHHRLTLANEQGARFPFGLLALPFAVCSRKRCIRQA